jgi:hypothetical protein
MQRAGLISEEVNGMNLASRQRGVTLVGLLLWGALIAFLFVVGMQAVPAVQESFSVQRTVDKVAKTDGSVEDIRAAFDKMAEVGYIESVKGADLQITKVNGAVVISYAYNKEIHIGGPAYLELKFSGQSH